MPCFASDVAPVLSFCLDEGRESPFMEREGGRGVVFKGPVQSGFLTSKWGNRNRNRSRTDPDIGWTEPDRLGLVFCGPWTEKRPVQTGFLT